MDKDKLINALNAKGMRNSIISLYYNTGRALPFIAQRFPDGRVSSWYSSQYVEVHEVVPKGKYGYAYGFYYRNGERADAYEDDPEHSWCKKDDVEPQSIPAAGRGSWVLLDILGEPTVEPAKVYSLNDVLDFGKYKGKTVKEVIYCDLGWIKWAVNSAERFFFDIDGINEEINRR